jgi:citrate lyase beta subunit
MASVLEPNRVKAILERLTRANQDVARRCPGESLERQPVHTVYGGAHLFKAASAVKLGELARRAFAEHAPDPVTFQRAVGMEVSRELAETVHARVGEKLQREAVEDFRIDFEDGFGIRPDAEEDAAAVAAGHETAQGLADGTLPPFIGIRVKSLSEELKGRAVRTLELYLSALLDKSGGKLPPGFVVTLPKVTSPAQVEAFVALLTLAEQGLKLRAGSLCLEIMVETPQALLDESGFSPLPRIVKAGLGRIVGAHLGAYDYTAACGITSSAQALDHPACDFARSMMKAAFAEQPIHLADGATNVLPVGPRETVHAAWALSYRHVRHALRNGFYQGWDLHPAQLPVRYGAVYAFFLEGLVPATARLKGFMEKAAQATRLGAVFDDAATGQGLLNFFIRGLSCGALRSDEVQATGLTLAEIQSRSFLKILAGR